MRTTHLFAPTLKQDPADAEVASHKLLIRAGMIRQVARGIYDLLPLGVRVLRKVEAIVRDELNRAGAQEILMPVVCPAELWQESGRWELYGKELLRLKDRYDRDFCFGPTHEEVVTDIVRREVRSYRDLPVNLYQIQVKFRDEVRPRFGLMRGREFIMKDGYSFHVDAADCRREYENMTRAYTRIFDRCGLEHRAVEADTGAIGGSLSHEFQVLADSGEDAIATCDGCGYTANVEKAAVAAPVAPGTQGASGSLNKVHTPNVRTVEEVSRFLGEPPERFIKTLLYTLDSGETVGVLVRGDRDISEAKLRAHFGVGGLALVTAETVERVTGAPIGFAGPIGLGVKVLADRTIAGLRGGVTGANENDHHLTGVDQVRDIGSVEFADVTQAREGDSCGRCGESVLGIRRGIEVGQVFYLGTKYSRPMKATFLDASGSEQPIEMGTYGIGITRTIAAAIEQNHDKAGIVWPIALAPFHVVVVPVSIDEPPQREAAERVYRELNESGVEALLDDRKERPGVKFKDADLIGVPFRVTVGPRALEQGCVEVKARADTEANNVPVGEASGRLAAEVSKVLKASHGQSA